MPAVAMAIFCDMLGTRMVIKSANGLWKSDNEPIDQACVILAYVGQGRFLRSHVGNYLFVRVSRAKKNIRK